MTITRPFSARASPMASRLVGLPRCRESRRCWTITASGAGIGRGLDARSPSARSRVRMRSLSTSAFWAAERDHADGRLAGAAVLGEAGPREIGAKIGWVDGHGRAYSGRGDAAPAGRRLHGFPPPPGKSPPGRAVRSPRQRLPPLPGRRRPPMVPQIIFLPEFNMRGSFRLAGLLRRPRSCFAVAGHRTHPRRAHRGHRRGAGHRLDVAVAGFSGRMSPRLARKTRRLGLLPSRSICGAARPCVRRVLSVGVDPFRPLPVLATSASGASRIRGPTSGSRWTTTRAEQTGETGAERAGGSGARRGDAGVHARPADAPDARVSFTDAGSASDTSCRELQLTPSLPDPAGPPEADFSARALGASTFPACAPLGHRRRLSRGDARRLSLTPRGRGGRGAFSESKGHPRRLCSTGTPKAVVSDLRRCRSVAGPSRASRREDLAGRDGFGPCGGQPRHLPRFRPGPLGNTVTGPLV